jgi:predicted RNA binding protein YcfA (HicA-like mRNA interferase family)
MKNGALLKRLRSLGCVLVRHGKKHDVYTNPRTGKIEYIPRHPDISEELAKKIIRNLS